MLKFTMTKEKIFHNDNKTLVVWLLLWSTLHLVLCISMILLKEHVCWCKSKLSKEASCLNLLWVQVPDLWFFFFFHIYFYYKIDMQNMCTRHFTKGSLTCCKKTSWKLQTIYVMKYSYIYQILSGLQLYSQHPVYFLH